jgi:hypothetical protein
MAARAASRATARPRGVCGVAPPLLADCDESPSEGARRRRERTRRAALREINQSYSILSGAAGFKVNLANSLLGIFNVRFHLGSAGLADRATPLVGVEYGF